MTADRTRDDEPEFFRMRTMNIEAQLGRSLRSHFADVLTQPLPPSFLQALRTLEKLSREDSQDQASPDGRTLN